MSNPNPRDREVHSREVSHQKETIRENDSSASGLLLGLTLAVLIGLGAAAFFLLNQRPATQAPGQTTIIDKTREVVPVPQPAPNVNITVPSPAPQPAPNVNITVPSPAAPAASPSPVDSSTPTPAPTNP